MFVSSVHGRHADLIPSDSHNASGSFVSQGVFFSFFSSQAAFLLTEPSGKILKYCIKHVLFLETCPPDRAFFPSRVVHLSPVYVHASACVCPTSRGHTRGILHILSYSACLQVLPRKAFSGPFALTSVLTTVPVFFSLRIVSILHSREIRFPQNLADRRLLYECSVVTEPPSHQMLCHRPRYFVCKTLVLLLKAKTPDQ